MRSSRGRRCSDGVLPDGYSALGYVVDVWAGMDVMILRGVTVGRGCTLAARSVVTKSTPPYSIVAGAPARFIKFYC